MEKLRRLVEEVETMLNSGTQLNMGIVNRCAEKIGITDKVVIMNATEIAITRIARKIATEEQSVGQKFEALKTLYQLQPIISPKDGLAKLLQQYSTPTPISYLASEFVNRVKGQASTRRFLEPTAGNGLLTIALNNAQIDVNELDKIRYNNLVNFLPSPPYRATNEDATTAEFADQYDGVVANPPFAVLDKKDYLIKRGKKGDKELEFAFQDLDHKIAILALDKMANSGRAAIIVGGKMGSRMKKHEEAYWKHGRLFGGFSTFVSYLNRQYNLLDVIYINGDLYARQGTSFPIVMLLIDGRKRWNSDPYCQWHTYDVAKDAQVNSFDELYKRILPHLGIIEFEHPKYDSVFKVGDIIQKKGSDEKWIIKDVSKIHPTASLTYYLSHPDRKLIHRDGWEYYEGVNEKKIHEYVLVESAEKAKRKRMFQFKLKLALALKLD